MVQPVSKSKLEYTGKVQPKPGGKDASGQQLYPYLPDENLLEAVRLTIFLQRPLLIKGEPGCGKTQLARAVAYELKLPYEAWHIKSTSRARDGLYTYDAVGRLRDAQLAATRKQSSAVGKNNLSPESYVRWGPLGNAFRNKQRTVVLIDEIDKADIDFPNDLLLELDEQRFLVEETGENIAAKTPPIVFITSNDEKDLPDAFLRRCLFHYIEFPTGERLQGIIRAHFPEAAPKLIEQAVARFKAVREKMIEDKGEGGKKASTSELIDWFRALKRFPTDKALATLQGALPYPSVLLKSWEDHQRYLAQKPSEV